MEIQLKMIKNLQLLLEVVNGKKDSNILNMFIWEFSQIFSYYSVFQDSRQNL